MFNKNKFKAKILESGYTVEKLAGQMGINAVTLYRKINEKTDFTRTEILAIKKILNLSVSDVDSIFFAHQLT